MLKRVELTKEQVEAVRVTKELVRDLAQELIGWGPQDLVYDDGCCDTKSHEQMMDIYRFLRELDEGVALIYDKNKMD
jgi:hypothetical protein